MRSCRELSRLYIIRIVSLDKHRSSSCRRRRRLRLASYAGNTTLFQLTQAPAAELSAVVSIKASNSRSSLKSTIWKEPFIVPSSVLICTRE